MSVRAQRDAEARAEAAEEDVARLESRLDDIKLKTGLWTVCPACGHERGQEQIAVQGMRTSGLQDAEAKREARRAERAELGKAVGVEDKSSPWVAWL